MQQVVDAKSLTLLQVLTKDLKMNCNGCYLHAIVDDVPLSLLVNLLKASDSVNQRHPELKNYIIHKVLPCCVLDVN